MKKVEPWSEKIVAGFGIQSWLEKSLIDTDLQSDEFIAGKWVILYYKTDDVLKSYKELKKERLKIGKAKNPEPIMLKELSKEFMMQELLSLNFVYIYNFL